MSSYFTLVFPLVGYSKNGPSSLAASSVVTSQAHLLSLIQIIALCYIIGSSIWMNFVNGIRLRKVISKVAFFDVQKALFPVYFANLQRVLFILILLQIHKLFPTFFPVTLPASTQQVYQSFFTGTYQAEFQFLFKSLQKSGATYALALSKDTAVHHVQLLVLVTAYLLTFINSAILTPLVSNIDRQSYLSFIE